MCVLLCVHVHAFARLSMPVCVPEGVCVCVCLCVPVCACVLRTILPLRTMPHDHTAGKCMNPR